MTQTINNTVDAYPTSHKDWDYVSMADYTKDTEDLVRLSNSMMEAYKKKVQELEKLIALLVHSVGKIEVHRHLLTEDTNLTIVREENLYNDSIIFRSALHG